MIVPLVVGIVVFVASARLLGGRGADDPAKRINRLVEPRRQAARGAEASRPSVFARATAATEPFLARVPGWEGFGRRLERAGIERRPAVVAWLIAGGAAAVALLVLAAGGQPFAAFLLMAAVVGAVFAWLKLRTARRRRAFEELLPDVLAEIASALRAGHGFLQGLQSVALDAPEPVGRELQRALAEARFGRPLEEALLDAGDRVRSQDFDFVLDAVIVQRQVGGSLAGIFEVVGESVRSRQQFAMKIRALTAMGRMSAAVLLALPFGIALMLTLVNSSYMSVLFTTSLGRTMLVLSFVLLGVGTMWLQRVAAAAS